MKFDADSYSDEELHAEFDRLFPHGFAGPDVFRELSPAGWAASPLLAGERRGAITDNADVLFGDAAMKRTPLYYDTVYVVWESHRQRALDQATSQTIQSTGVNGEVTIGSGRRTP
jgi:hypothetical protein